MTPEPISGPIRVTSRTVFAIAIPMTLAFMTVPFVGAVDLAVVGQAGSAADTGGIAVAAVLFDVLFATCNFLRSGTTGLTAQALGAGRRIDIEATLLRALLLALAIGLVLVLASGPLLAAGLLLIAPGPEVADAARRYFAIRVLGAPFALINFAVFGWVLGLARSRTGLALQTWLNGVNIAAALGLGLWAGLGIEGVAWGTVIAEASAALVGLAVAARIGGDAFRPAFRRLADRAGFLAMLAVNRDIMIRSFVLLLAFSLFTRFGAGFGDVVLAANAILMNLFMVGGYFLDGLATAAEQLAGRALGAGERSAFVAAVRLSVVWGVVLSLVLALAFLLGGGYLIDLMSRAPEVRETARAFLPWAALTPLVGVLAFEMDGVYIGATWSREMRNMMLLSMGLFLAVAFAAVPLLGNHGLWLALLVFLGARGGTLAARLPARMAASFP